MSLFHQCMKYWQRELALSQSMHDSQNIMNLQSRVLNSIFRDRHVNMPAMPILPFHFPPPPHRHWHSHHQQHSQVLSLHLTTSLGLCVVASQDSILLCPLPCIQGALSVDARAIFDRQDPLSCPENTVQSLPADIRRHNFRMGRGVGLSYQTCGWERVLELLRAFGRGGCGWISSWHSWSRSFVLRVASQYLPWCGRARPNMK
mmetsp:Transcript_25362/g.53581  ORF Transcript_25362/g.53581 Transcript_25362/m.53581 type:complete len:203 (+) Transcript_25362:147-755(+)